jgi:hypothetical protein
MSKPSYHQIDSKYRLLKDNSVYNNKSNYYRLYEKYEDDFGNVNYKQMWSGGTGGFDGKFAEWLYNALESLND